MNNNKDLPLIRPCDPDDGREIFDDPFNVVSGMECTGLVPSAPYDGSEIDSYSRIYDIPLSSVQTADKPEDERKKHTEEEQH